MSGLWQKIKQTVYQGASVAAEKAEELGRIGKKRLDIASKKQEISRTCAELGASVYHLWETGKGAKTMDQPEVQRLIEQIKVLEADLQEKEAELERMKAPSEKETTESSASDTSQ